MTVEQQHQHRPGKKCNQKYHLLFNRSDKPDKSNRKYNQL